MASNIPGELSKFYKKTLAERRGIVESIIGASGHDSRLLRDALNEEVLQADLLSENVISSFALPFSVATNFIINEKPYLVPMATEEASVVAAASYAAKLARPMGGFSVQGTDPVMVGQIVLTQINNHSSAIHDLENHKHELLEKANSYDQLLCSLGGGVRDMSFYEQQTSRGTMLVIHLHVDVRDAMGANIINTMAEALAPDIEKITGGKALLKIVSNLTLQRRVKAQATWSKDSIGAETVQRILDAYAFADVNSHRATTHNKGIMNGIDAVALATGNDTRAIEAGAHAFAAQDGCYKSLTVYQEDDDGNLQGSLEIPLAVGIVGGITNYHKMAKLALKILNVSSSGELAMVMGAVGLAQNFAALRALVGEGIQKGHMRLHERKGR